MECRFYRPSQKLLISMHRSLIATQEYVLNVIAVIITIMKNFIILIHLELSKECRKEMQYYKLLAKEVEKRISVLKPYVIESDSESSEDRTDAPELPENEQNYELPQEEILAGFNVNIDRITAVTHETSFQKSPCNSPQPYSVKTDYSNNVTVSNTITTPSTTNSPKKFVIDLSLSINESGKSVLETIKNTPKQSSPPIELPERDYNCPKKITKEILTEVDSLSKKKNCQTNIVEDIVNFSFSIDKDILSDPFPDLSINRDGPSSLSSKSFTGSLIDIHTESLKESQISAKLIRQHSYTLLKPSPQLLAHLEVQSLNTGVDMNCISMSESLSNLSSPNKKRRSWDLESAKVKWSSMALELNQKNVNNTSKVNGANKNNLSKPTPKKVQQPSPPRSRSVVQEKIRRPAPGKAPPKSEPTVKPTRKALSPVRNAPSTRAVAKDSTTPKTPYVATNPTINQVNQRMEPVTPNSSGKPISESEDPAARVRELYEKIQKQQLVQMANLVEKQKKEQLLLQQVFEEQNSILYKQLKTICPKSPVEVKEAWGDKLNENADRGPVSLSQLINQKTPDNCGCDSPVSSTLTDTNNYINRCDDVLRRSKDITSNIKKQQPNISASKSPSMNGAKMSSPRLKAEGSRTRTQSPASRNTSRRLNYDTSASSVDCEPMLTDRTNDTLADLNVTFPSDNSDEAYFIQNGIANHNKEITVVHRSPLATGSDLFSRTSDNLVKRPEELRPTSMSNICRRTPPQFMCQPTPEQITAACYALHDTFIASTPAERCAVIAADRRRRSLAARAPPPAAAQRNQRPSWLY